jgi:plastocyanin
MQFRALAFTLFAVLAPVFVQAANITVIVGANEDGTPANVIRPNQITAKVGDLITFVFRGGNHTITQSSFAEPCTQQLNTVTKKKGADSGFMPYNATSGQVPGFTVNVTQDTSAIWLFCARKPHCTGSKMVAAINAPTTGEKTFEAFLAKVPTANEPGYGITADFTPTAGNTTAPSAAAPRWASGATPAMVLAGTLAIFIGAL